MSAIISTATFSDIQRDNFEPFKEVARSLVEHSRSEVGTKLYDWYFSDDRKSCVVIEIYENSDAVIAHGSSEVLHELEKEMLRLGGHPKLAIYGPVSAELQGLLDAWPIKFDVYRDVIGL